MPDTTPTTPPSIIPLDKIISDMDTIIEQLADIEAATKNPQIWARMRQHLGLATTEDVEFSRLTIDYLAAITKALATWAVHHRQNEIIQQGETIKAQGKAEAAFELATKIAAQAGSAPPAAAPPPPPPRTALTTGWWHQMPDGKWRVAVVLDGQPGDRFAHF